MASFVVTKSSKEGEGQRGEMERGGERTGSVVKSH